MKRLFALFLLSAVSLACLADLRPLDFKPELWKSSSKALLASASLEPDPEFDGDQNRELRESICKSSSRSGLTCEHWRLRLRLGSDEFMASASFSKAIGLVELAIVMDLRAADAEARLERLIATLNRTLGNARTSSTQRGSVEITALSWEQGPTNAELRRTSSASRKTASLTLTSAGWSRGSDAGH